jgi:hypothetical protein
MSVSAPLSVLSILLQITSLGRGPWEKDRMRAGTALPMLPYFSRNQFPKSGLKMISHSQSHLLIRLVGKLIFTIKTVLIKAVFRADRPFRLVKVSVVLLRIVGISHPITNNFFMLTSNLRKYYLFFNLTIHLLSKLNSQIF